RRDRRAALARHLWRIQADWRLPHPDLWRGRLASRRRSLRLLAGDRRELRAVRALTLAFRIDPRCAEKERLIDGIERAGKPDAAARNLRAVHRVEEQRDAVLDGLDDPGDVAVHLRAIRRAVDPGRGHLEV